MKIPERIAELRREMKAFGMDAYIVPTADFHQSEYVGEYFKCVYYWIYRIRGNRADYRRKGVSLDRWTLFHPGSETAGGYDGGADEDGRAGSPDAP